MPRSCVWAGRGVIEGHRWCFCRCEAEAVLRCRREWELGDVGVEWTLPGWVRPGGKLFEESSRSWTSPGEDERLVGSEPAVGSDGPGCCWKEIQSQREEIGTDVRVEQVNVYSVEADSQVLLL